MDLPQRCFGIRQIRVKLLPLVVGSPAQALFELFRNMPDEARTPVPLFEEEARNAIPNRSVETARNGHWAEIPERVAKEGGRRGRSLTAISQNPSEPQRAVCSRTRNILALRLARDEDRNMIAKLPACDQDPAALLSDLNDGEVPVGGDARAMPPVVGTAVPKYKPRSKSIGTARAWNPDEATRTAGDAIEKMRLRQGGFPD